MVDEPKANQNADKPEQKQSKLPTLPNTVRSSNPTSTSQTQENNPTKKRDYAKYAMWPFVGIWRGIKTGLRWLKAAVELVNKYAGAITAAATIAIGILTCFYVGYSQKQWQVARDTLSVSQRAYVTIGRKDGAVGDVIVPTDPKRNAEIVMYFQNSGHLPAKFGWGNMAAISQQNARIQYTHPYKGPFRRTKDRKTGAISEEGESTIIAGDSVFVAMIGIISQKDLANLSTSPGAFYMMGTYQYCDDIGSHDFRQFALTYRGNAPSSTLNFALANNTSMDIVLTAPEPTATTEYLFPCETVAERDENQKKAAKSQSLVQRACQLLRLCK